MWKPGKPEERTPVAPAAPAPQWTNTAPPTPKETRPVETSRFNEPRTEMAHIGKSVIIKGELSGSEDLYLDGEVEGTIELRDNSLTVGPNGRVRANTHAKDVVVHGKVNGNLRADRVELKKSALVTGDIITQRVVIEDGAFFKGGIDIQREQAKEAPKAEARPVEARPVVAPVSASAAVGVGSTPGVQGSLIEAKKL
jgi:cytoskeletal protein CcmA (bactofilin family)